MNRKYIKESRRALTCDPMEEEDQKQGSPMGKLMIEEMRQLMGKKMNGSCKYQNEVLQKQRRDAKMQGCW